VFERDAVAQHLTFNRPVSFDRAILSLDLIFSTKGKKDHKTSYSCFIPPGMIVPLTGLSLAFQVLLRSRKLRIFDNLARYKSVKLEHHLPLHPRRTALT
jgi:hypothetical protein